MRRNMCCDAQKEFAVIAFFERLLERLTAPYAEQLARMDDTAFRALLARF